ncbi:boron transporter 4-like protein [Carex littledalei]|uniref:Boron transporter 4-like protein n=1 Tax=Carex littledalei TaxID=544730 RepID=A0A833RWG8_9POAL|nr:boron transporter 4-like protein [Carex littledalei]
MLPRPLPFSPPLPLPITTWIGTRTRTEPPHLYPEPTVSTSLIIFWSRSLIYLLRASFDSLYLKTSVETLTSTAVCGIIHSIIGGQSMLIVGVAESAISQYQWLLVDFHLSTLAWLKLIDEAIEEEDESRISLNCEAQHRYLT